MPFYRLAERAADLMGRSWAFIAACLSVLLWAAAGPLFSFSSAWQLVINTGTTVVTFLVIFLVQNATNRNALATMAKLNIIIEALKEADNSSIGIDALSDRQLKALIDEHRRRAPDFELPAD